MKRLLFPLSAVLVVSMILLFVGCQSESDLLSEYKSELARARSITKMSLTQAGENVKATADGEQYRKRVDEIVVIEANTIKFIDGNPKYAGLLAELWKGKKEIPPQLAWGIPKNEIQNEQYQKYLEYWIDLHWLSVGEDRAKN